NAFFVRVAIEVVDACSIEKRRASLDAVHDVILVQQQLGEVSAVLPCNAGDKRHFAHSCLPFSPVAALLSPPARACAPAARKALLGTLMIRFSRLSASE